MSAPGDDGAAGFTRRLVEDARFAYGRFVFTTLGGSPWIPRFARRLMFAAAGATVASSPGTGFRFAGSPRNLTLGRGVYLNVGVFIEAVAPVVIGDRCSVGMDVMILTSHHPIDASGSWSPAAQGRAVTIGERVWIGARALVLPGATIESDVVVAAGAVVRGHCAARGVYAGIPARRIRDLDPGAAT